MKRGTYSIFLFIIHEGCNGTALVRTVTGLAMNMDGSMSDPELVDRTRDDMGRSGMAVRRHE